MSIVLDPTTDTPIKPQTWGLKPSIVGAKRNAHNEAKRVSLYNMAIGGINLAAVNYERFITIRQRYNELVEQANRNDDALDSYITEVMMVCVRGLDVYQAIEHRGIHNGIRSLGDAKALRMLLVWGTGGFDGLQLEANNTNQLPRHIAEQRCSMRDAELKLFSEWR